MTTVRFNPWTLALEAEGFALLDTDDSPLIGFEKLRLNLQISSLFRWALVFREVHLAGPSFNLVREGANQTNIGRLAAETPTSEDSGNDEGSDADLLRLVIHELKLSNGRIKLTDEVPVTAFETQATPINIVVNNLSTLLDDQGDQSIRIETEGDGVIEWNGTFQLNPLSSEGTLSLRVPGLPLVTRYLDDVLDFDLDGGLLDTSFNYSIRTVPDGSIAAGIDDFNLNISDTQLATEADAESFFAFENLQVSGGEIRWPEATASIEQVVLTAPTLDIWLDRNGELNLTRLLEQQTPDSVAEAPDAAEQSASAGSEAPTFNLSLNRLVVDAATSRFEDRSLAQPGAVEISSLDLEVREITNTPNALFPLELNVAVAAGGTLAVTGTVGVVPQPVADLKVSIGDVALNASQPWLTPLVTATLDDGSISGKLDLKSSPAESLDVRGQLTVDALKVSDDGGAELLQWQQLDITDLIFFLNAGELEIANLTLREPFARVEFDADRQLNFAKNVREQAGSDTAQPDEAAEPFVFRMGTSSIENGRVDFTDLSLPLPFSTMIQEFTGTISALASDTRQPSVLDFNGRVGEFGQAKLTGQLIALQPLEESAVRLEFINLNMPDLSPYTVQFAGRKVAAGKLNLDLGYSVDAAQLKGDNRIVVEQIQLGERIDSPDALDLPLDLAIALLSDSNGVIDIELTIDGDASNPDFNAGGLIAKTLGSLLVKAVTSPFRLLAGLAGGGEDVDLQNVGFEPGDAKLSPPSEEKLVRLSVALAQRPSLQLAVPGAYSAELDTAGLAKARVKVMAEAKLESTDSDALLAERANEVYEELARERLPDLDIRQLRASFVIEDDDPDTPDFDILSYLTALEEALIADITVTEAELKALGEARATSIIDYFRDQTDFDGQLLIAAEPRAVEPGEDNLVSVQLELNAR